MNNQFYTTIFMTTSLLVGCGTNNKTKIATTPEKPKNESFPAHVPGRVGFMTAANLTNNEINNFLKTNLKKLNYKLEGDLNFDSKLTPTSTRVYGIKYIDSVIKILKSLEDNRVDLTFAQIDKSYSKTDKTTSSILTTSVLKTMRANNKHKLFEALSKKHIYQGKLILLQNNDESNSPRFNWNKLNNVALFKYSQIFSSYMLGYQIQSHYGANDKPVGYLLAALISDEGGAAKTNVNLVNAFWTGVTTASAKDGIGEANYARGAKTDSKKDLYQKLFFNFETSKKEFTQLAEDSNYKNQEHSIVYLAGMPGTQNSRVANILKNYSVNNDNGHKMIINEPESSDNFAFSKPGKSNVIVGKSSNHNVEGSITATLYVKDVVFNKELQRKNNANKLAMELILKHLYQGENPNINYFNKTNYIGNLNYLLSTNDKWLPFKLVNIKDIFNKTLTVDDLIQKDITGYKS